MMMGKPKKNDLAQIIVELIKKKRPIICNTNDKGGVGKTTLAAHEAWMADLLGLKVLIVDFEKHLSKLMFGNLLPELPGFASATDLFRDEGIEKPIYKVPGWKNIYILPADHGMKDIDTIPMESGIVVNPLNNLQEIMEEYQFDIGIIDTPPVTGNRQQAGLLAASNVVLVTEMSALSLEAVSDAIGICNSLISNINERNPGVNMLTPKYLIVPNKFNSRRSRNQYYLDELKRSGIKLSPHIQDREPLAQAIDMGKPVWSFDDGNSRLAAKNIRAVLENVLMEVGA
ncbi:ParA family protein [Dickeya sp. NCPPB 3274]|uniref:ParA family protein n=1 Tax=Dickeya sp. NCPPB 3274 TaxID=568766 RepID=UPI0005B347C5|nr:ParA family protein [Dickeya sp. NCPPB 3274]